MKPLAKPGIVSDEFYAGRHTFTLKNSQLTEVLKQTVKIMEAKE